MTQMIKCVKLGQELPGLEKPPVPGELGERIFKNVSQQGWNMWLQYQVLLINHNGLVMAHPGHRQFLMEQLEEFFFGKDTQMPEGWTPEDTPGAEGDKTEREK